MFLTVHAASGILMGVALKEPVSAGLLSMLLHFGIDAVPHEHRDDNIEGYPKDLPKSEVETIRRKITFSIDLLVMTAISAWTLHHLYSNDLSLLLLPVAAGIFGSILPDLIAITTLFLDFKALRWYFSFHHRVHFVFGVYSLPRYIAFPMQALIAAILLYGSYLLL